MENLISEKLPLILGGDLTMVEREKHQKKLVVSDAALPFVARGGRIFERQVVDSDLDIADGEEVLVVDTRGRALTVAEALV
jgi:archaeosine-15-forming tRNA-guanine transglycosylase